MKIINPEVLQEIGNRNFPPPFERVIFDALNARITSPTHPEMRVTVMETGILVATIQRPSSLTLYKQIFDKINQLIGENYFDDSFGRGTLRTHTSRLRGKIEDCLRGEEEYQPSYRVLQAVADKGYVLLP